MVYTCIQPIPCNIRWLVSIIFMDNRSTMLFIGIDMNTRCNYNPVYCDIISYPSYVECYRSNHYCTAFRDNMLGLLVITIGHNTSYLYQHPMIISLGPFPCTQELHVQQVLGYRTSLLNKGPAFFVITFAWLTFNGPINKTYSPIYWTSI